MKKLMVAVGVVMVAAGASALDLSITAVADDGMTAGQRLTNAVTQINAAGGGKLTIAPGEYDLTGLYMNTGTYAVQNSDNVVNYKEHLLINKSIDFVGENNVHWDGGDGKNLSATAVVIKGDGRFLRATGGAHVYNIYFKDFTGALDHPEYVPRGATKDKSNNLLNESLGGVLNFSEANNNYVASNCVFISNLCRSGGAVSSGVMRDCYFERNHAKYAGGVGRTTYYQGCKIIDNYSDNVDGVSWWVTGMYDCYVKGNHANERGVMYTTDPITVSNCAFVANYANSATVATAQNMTMVDCVFSNNYNSSTASTTKSGCLVLNTGCEIRRCEFVDNRATTSNGTDIRCGAAVYSEITTEADIPWLYECVFSNNVVNSYGGAVNGCSVSNCYFYGNVAGEFGGAYRPMKNGKALDCLFVSNRVERFGTTLATACRGGAIGLDKASALVSNCVFVCNAAFTNGYNSSRGGAISAIGGSSSAKIMDCAFTNNSAFTAGGAVYDESSYATMSGCDFYTNVCFGVGIGGAVSGGIITNCVFTYNTASGEGGAVALSDVCRVYNSIFVTNFVTGAPGVNRIGGGAIGTYSGGNTVRVRGCTFIGNFIKGTSNYNFHGGAFNDSSTSGSKVHDCIFIGNHAPSYGGACYGGGFSNCVFIGNYVEYKTSPGGAVCGKNWPGEYILDCQFISNRLAAASTSSGAAYYSMLTGNGDKLKTTNLVARCTFAYNWTDSDNGKIAAFAASRTNVLAGCVFATNLVRSGGVTTGQIMTNCTFAGNIVPYGGGVVSGCRVLDSVFKGNSRMDTHFGTFSTESTITARNHADYGGTDGYNSDFYDCDFSNGGLAFQGCTLDRCVIHDVTAAQSELTGTHCVFFGGNHVTNTLVKGVNLWYLAARAIFFAPSSPQTEEKFSSSSYVNCTFRDYSFDGNNGGSCYSVAYDKTLPTLALNSIFINGKNRYNSHREISASTSGQTFAMSNCVAGSVCIGAFNKGSKYMPNGQDLGGVQINNAVATYKFVDGRKDARYADAAADSLQSRSPYRNIGDASVFAAGAKDLAGNDRVKNGKVDLGAYECWVPQLRSLMLVW